MKENKTKIMKFENISLKGFQPNTLYCFNYNLKGELCNKCISKQMCETEQKRLNFYYSEIKKMAEKDSMSLKNILSNKLDYK